MAIRDLLWACPYCGTEGALRKARGGANCGACDARFRRSSGAQIVGVQPGGPELLASPAEWLERLPDLEVFGQDGAPRKDRTIARFGVGTRTYRRGGEVLGFAPEFGARVPGLLVLERWKVVFRPDSGTHELDQPRTWPLENISAVQASSSAVLLKPKGDPVVTFRFPDGSVRFWENLLEEALRVYYRQQGRGEIREFRPTIVTA